MWQNNVVEEDMQVDPRHHRHFVTRRGEVLHRISEECGGVTISFPRSGVQSDRVVLKGAQECIAAAKQRIVDIVKELVRCIAFYSSRLCWILQHFKCMLAYVKSLI